MRVISYEIYGVWDTQITLGNLPTSSPKQNEFPFHSAGNMCKLYVT